MLKSAGSGGHGASWRCSFANLISGEEVSRLTSCLGLTARGAKDRRDVDGKSLVL